MPNEQKEQNVEVFATWEVPEYNHHERSKSWYVVAIAVVILLLAYSYLTYNFLLPVIIIIVMFIFIMRHGQEPSMILVGLNDHGLTIGSKFYDYNEFRNFSIVYKPLYNDKNLYFEFGSAYKPRLSIPLMDMDPVETRNHLLNFLEEDVERTDIPLSEQISKTLKL